MAKHRDFLQAQTNPALPDTSTTENGSVVRVCWGSGVAVDNPPVVRLASAMDKIGKSGFETFDLVDTHTLRRPGEVVEFTCDTAGKRWIISNNVDGLRYRDEWESGRNYYRDDVVFDSGWQMRANQVTQERPAPQPIGASEWASTEGDTPTWATANENSEAVLWGCRYTMVQGRFLTNVRYWVPLAAPTMTYELWLIRDPSTNPVFTNISPAVVHTVANQWYDLPQGVVPKFTGDEFDLVCYVQSNTGLQTASRNYNWLRNDNGVAAAGEIRHQAGGGSDTLRVSYTDDDSTDNTTLLQNLPIGSNIVVVGGGVTYEVIGKEADTFDMVYTIQPTTRVDTAALYQIDFQSYGAIPIDVVSIVNRFAPQPTPAVTQRGLIATDGNYPQLLVDDDMYGVDASFQDAQVSEHWNLMMFSGFGT